MLWGYTKKMVIADNLSHYVSLVYGDVGSMSGPNLVAATVLFAVQLYMDFSGCCDIFYITCNMICRKNFICCQTKGLSPSFFFSILFLAIMFTVGSYFSLCPGFLVFPYIF